MIPWFKEHLSRKYLPSSRLLEDQFDSLAGHLARSLAHGICGTVLSLASIICAGGSVSSTGVVAIHAGLIPGTNTCLIWGREQPDFVPPQPGLRSADGVAEVSTLYDYVSGTYQVKPMRLHPFCSGHSHLSDGTLIAAGGKLMNVGDPIQYLPLVSGLFHFANELLAWVTTAGRVVQS